jgi:sugar lactone lactonase YvrE
VEFIDLLDSKEPLLTIGSDDEDSEVANYKKVRRFYVDRQGSIYIPDLGLLRIDKFDSDGNYLFSFGRKGEGPGEFPMGIGSFAVDSKGRLITNLYDKQVMIIFSADGKRAEERKIPKEMKLFIVEMEMDDQDRLYLLLFSPQKMGYILGWYDYIDHTFTPIHEDYQRTRLDFMDLMPDFTFDPAGNIYITDTIEYKIFKYSPEGKLLRIFSKEMAKHKIVEKDFNVIYMNKIMKVPYY